MWGGIQTILVPAELNNTEGAAVLTATIDSDYQRAMGFLLYSAGKNNV